MRAVGDILLGSLTAPDNVYIYTLGNLGMLGSASPVTSSAANVFIRSEGNVSAPVDAFRDVAVVANGNITSGGGTIHSGRDALIYAYGSYNAATFADRDVHTVTAGGGITGIISGDRHVGEPDEEVEFAHVVDSFANINAAIFSPNLASWTDGGIIAGVVANGSIAGPIVAATAIGGIQAGGAVTAFPILPLPTGGVTQNDTDLAARTAPTPPASQSATILSNEAEAHTDVLNAKADVQSALEEALDAAATARNETDAAIATEQFNVSTQVTNTQTEAATALGTAAVKFEERLHKLREEHADAVNGVATSAAELESQIQQAIDNTAARRDEQHTRRVNSANQRVDELENETDPKIDGLKSLAQQKSTEAITKRQLRWEEWKKADAEKQAERIREYNESQNPPTPEDVVNATHDSGAASTLSTIHIGLLRKDPQGLENMAEIISQKQRGTGAWGMDLVQAFGESLPGAGVFFEGIKLSTGKDIWGREVTTGDRVMAGVGVGLTLLGMRGLGGADDLASSQWRANRNRMDSVCNVVSHGRGCFVAGTPVHVMEEGSGTWYATTVGVAAGGLATFVVLQRRHNRKRREEQAQLIDEFFGEDALDDLLMPKDDPSDFEPANEKVDNRQIGDLYMKPTSASLNSRDSATALLEAPCTTEVEITAARRTKSPQRSRPRPRINRTGLGVLLVTLLLGALCAFKGATTLERTTKPIERMRTGDTLPYNVNPAGEEDREFGETIVPGEWRNLFLKAPKKDGSWAEVELMLPVSHLETHNARVGGTIPISVPECGIDGDATVLKIEPCPDLPGDPNLRIVTGVFKHHNAKVVDVALSDGTVTGSTPNHLWWSDDRLDFVRADELRAGENLQTIDGASLTVASVTPRPGRHTVYNLQVHFTHVYHVGAGGALVHNSSQICRSFADRLDGLYDRAKGSALLAESLGGTAGDNVAHHLIPMAAATTDGLKTFFRKAVGSGWDMNGKANGLFLNSVQHPMKFAASYHKKYNEYVESQLLKYIANSGGVNNVTGQQAKKYLKGLASRLKTYINKHPNTYIDDLFEY